MANLTFTTPRNYAVLPSLYLDYPMAAGVTIYEGSALSDTGSNTTGTGVAETLVAGENFLGFANTTETTVAGTTGNTINVVASGYVQLVVNGVTAASTGAEVYASDGNTFTIGGNGTSSSSSGGIFYSPIGKIVKIISGTTVLVKFEGVGIRSV